MRARAALALLLALAAGCGGDAGPARDDPLDEATARLFAFDHARPLDASEGETATEVTFVVKGMSYASPGGDRVSGIVAHPRFLPEGAPGVIFMHGSGGSRADFLDEAARLAERGAVAMTIDSPFARSQRADVRAGYGDDATIRRLLIRNVQDLVRGLDVLVERYDADPERLAIVGYSMGVQAATLAAALDPRVRAVVLMAGRARPSGGQRAFEALDTVRHVGHLPPARLLVQGGALDVVVPRDEVEALYAAAREPKEIRWYPAGHELGNRSATERLDWLTAELGLR